MVGGGTGSDCTSQRQDSAGTQGKGLSTTRDSRIIPRRKPWKRVEDGEKQEATTDGPGRTQTDRQWVRQDPDKTVTASADMLRKQAGQPRTDGHIDVTVEEQKHGKRGNKGDSTLTNIGPMDRYVAVEAPSHRVRVQGV